MIYGVLYLLIFMICIMNIKVKKGDIVESNKRINIMRGVFAIGIILTHCSDCFSTIPLLMLPFKKFSTFGVAYFFIMSGYGLALSYSEKENYLQSFLQRKIVKLAMVALVASAISGVIAIYILKKESFGIWKNINWYIKALVVLYVLFWLAYKLGKQKKTRVLLVWIFTIIFTLITFELTKLRVITIRSYYISEWAFPLGITVYEYRHVVEKLMEKYTWKLDIAMFFFLIVTFIAAFSFSDYTIGDLFFHNVMLMPFYYFLIVIFKYVSMDNVIIRFLSKISLEMYLYQFIMLGVVRLVHPQISFGYVILEIVFTILLAFVVHVVYGKVSKKCGR